MNYLILIIPYLMKKPEVFNRFLNPDIENPLTLEEINACENWQERYNLVNRIILYVNTLPMFGNYKNVIDFSTPVYIKNDKKYFVYCINKNRFSVKSENFDSFVNNELYNIQINSPDIWSLFEEKEIVITITNRPQMWLEINDYKQEMVVI